MKRSEQQGHLGNYAHLNWFFGRENCSFDLAGAFTACPHHSGLSRGRKQLLEERCLVMGDEFQIDKNNWIVKVAFSERLTGRKQIDEFDNTWVVEDGKQKILERGQLLREDYQNRQINF
jgi:glycogen debranching enzyme